MINIAFIGAGDIAEMHAAAVEAVEGARLIAVTDLQRERAERLASRYGARVLPGVAELLRTPGLDLVYILTPPAAHAGQIAAAAQAGIPIVCEKPLTLTLAEADGAIAAARQADVPLMTGLSHRFHPLAAQARELLLNGELGDFVAVWSHRLTRLHVQPGHWLGVRAQSGGVTLQYAMHDLDWECWLGGEVARLAAQDFHTNPEVDIEDNLWAHLHFRNGGSGSLGVSWSAPHAHTERGLVGSRGNLRILDQRRLAGQTAGGRTLETNLGDGYNWQEVFIMETRDAVSRLSHGEPFSVSGEDGRRALEISLAVQQAALTHQMVTLPLQNERAAEATK